MPGAQRDRTTEKAVLLWTQLAVGPTNHGTGHRGTDHHGTNHHYTRSHNNRNVPNVTITNMFRSRHELPLHKRKCTHIEANTHRRDGCSPDSAVTITNMFLICHNNEYASIPAGWTSSRFDCGKFGEPAHACAHQCRSERARTHIMYAPASTCARAKIDSHRIWPYLVT